MSLYKDADNEAIECEFQLQKLPPPLPDVGALEVEGYKVRGGRIYWVAWGRKFLK